MTKDSIITEIASKYNIQYKGYTYDYKHMVYTGIYDDIYNFSYNLRNEFITEYSIFQSSYIDDPTDIYNRIPIYAIWV